jgi:hypothetical protein
MSDSPDRERVRALLEELDKVQRESEQIRAKITAIREKSPEPTRGGDPSRPFGESRDPSKKSRS